MAGFNPYDIIIRPVGRFTSEKVLNAAERMQAGEMEDYRKASREEIATRRAELRKITLMSELSADDRKLAISRRLNAAKRKMTPEEFKKAKKGLEDNEDFTKVDQELAVKAEIRRILKTRRAQRRAQNANQNKVVFIVRDTATKPDIRRAIEQVYAVKVIRVNTLHTRRGKRAIIKLSPKDNAEDIYTRLGQM